MIVHAGLIALRVADGWAGVLIEGPSGIGKSDLALRALAAGFRLVADDRTRLFVSAGALFGAAPAPLAGLIEARGVGIVAAPPLRFAPVRLAVRCATGPEAIERLPDPHLQDYLGVRIPTLALWPFEHSAPAKLAYAIVHLGGRP